MNIIDYIIIMVVLLTLIFVIEEWIRGVYHEFDGLRNREEITKEIDLLKKVRRY